MTPNIILKCQKHGDLTLDKCNKHGMQGGKQIYRCKQCLFDIRKTYYEKNKDTVKIRTNQYRKNNPDKVLAIRKAYWLENKEKIKIAERARRKLYDLRHPEQERMRSRRYKRKASKELRDSYIKCKLVMGTNLSRRDIPPEIIEIKRLQIQIKRKIKTMYSQEKIYGKNK